MSHKTHTIEPLEARIAPAVLLAIEHGTNQLLTFDSAAPGTLLSEITITGLKANEIIVGIDSDLASGELYAIGPADEGATRSLTAYRNDPPHGVVIATGGGSGGLADTDRYGMDVCGTGIRVTNNFDRNFVTGFYSAPSASGLECPGTERNRHRGCL